MKYFFIVSYLISNTNVLQLIFICKFLVASNKIISIFIFQILLVIVFCSFIICDLISCFRYLFCGAIFIELIGIKMIAVAAKFVSLNGLLVNIFHHSGLF